jgi:hypothetical protein
MILDKMRYPIISLFFANTNTHPHRHDRQEGPDEPGAPVGGPGLLDMISNIFRTPTAAGYGNAEGRGGAGMGNGGYTFVFGGPGGMRTIRVGGQHIGGEGTGADRSGNNEQEQNVYAPPFFECVFIHVAHDDQFTLV